MKKKIVYVHGLGSGANSTTGQLLKNTLPDCKIVCVEMPSSPLKAYESLAELAKKERPNLIVGTSLGGFYTMLISGCKKLIINPAMQPDKDILNAIGLGTYEYFCERQDKEKTYTVDEQMIADLEFLKNRFYSQWLDWEVKYETHGIFGKNDELFSHVETYKQNFYEEQMSIIDMGHRITKDSVSFIVKKIREIIYDNNAFNLDEFPIC